jgi:hypothetical protein
MERCVDCGLPITQEQPSHYIKGAEDDFGKTYHAWCWALWTQTQQREQYAEELWCAHKWLDGRSVPRELGGGKLSLVGRMMRLIGTAD